MTYEPLHHKYRPQTFAELVGQEAIATTFTNALSSGRIAPAYLLTGPRGTGKTSSARILAKSLNCLSQTQPTPTPCGRCEVCRAIARGSALDVVEIDAASHTGVDNIREMIERAQFAPVQCRYKVYVIDECHMLSTAAFNALLKTLEEPPQRVVFVLATTDPQRVLPTIISRCQRFDYRRIPLGEMVDHLQFIAQQEKISIGKEALVAVAQLAKGGLRDAQSLLDQLSLLSGTITVGRVWELVGAVPEEELLALLSAIADRSPEAVLEQCRRLVDRGREPLVVLQNLASFYLNLLIAKTAPTRTDLVAVTESTWQQLCAQAPRWELSTILQGQQRLKNSEAQLKSTTQPYLWLEITLLELLPPTPRHIEAPSETSPTIEDTPNAPPSASALGVCVPGRVPVVPPGESDTPLEPPQTTDTPVPQPTEKIPPNEPPVEEIPQPDKIWQEMLTHLQPPTTQALLSQHGWLMRLEGSVARIGVKNKALLGIAQSKLTNIEAAFQAACGRPIKVNLQIATPESSVSVLAPSEKDSPPEFEEPDGFAPPEPPLQERHPPTEHLNGSSDSPHPNSPVESPPLFVPSTPENNSSHDSSTSALSEATEESNPEAEIERAAQSLAHCFDGEIVTLGDYANDEPLFTASDPDELSSAAQPMIRGRPDLTDCEEDELPF